MKRNYTRPVWLAMLGTASILCLAALLSFSGCDPEIPPDPCFALVLDGDLLADIQQVQPITIVGPDGLQACGKEGTYTVAGFEGLPGQWLNMQWAVSGDLQFTSDLNFTPVTIVGTKDNGSGTLRLVTTGSGRGDCPADQIMATKTIVTSFASTITINADICRASANNSYFGTLTLVDKSFLPKIEPAVGIDDVVWTVLPAGSAVLTPHADKVTCNISNITSDCTVVCQLTSGVCTSDAPLSTQITLTTLPVCQ